MQKWDIPFSIWGAVPSTPLAVLLTPFWKPPKKLSAYTPAGVNVFLGCVLWNSLTLRLQMPSSHVTMLQLYIQCFQLTVVRPLLWFLLLVNVFSHKTVIMKAFVLKLGENVGTSFIFSLANFGRSSLNGYVVITTK